MVISIGAARSVFLYLFLRRFARWKPRFAAFVTNYVNILGLKSLEHYARRSISPNWSSCTVCLILLAPIGLVPQGGLQELSQVSDADTPSRVLFRPRTWKDWISVSECTFAAMPAERTRTVANWRITRRASRCGITSAESTRRLEWRRAWQLELQAQFGPCGIC